ncbi:dynein heavy chain, cytoplasmic [Ditylenchus destructor]|nr:dynein heavy chain, cytoplasmic [Ditylenchus destructor]
MENYIVSTASILLGENYNCLLQNALESATDCLQRFISDQQTSVFAVNRCVVRDESYAEDNMFTYTASSDITYRPEQRLSILFIKKYGIIELEKPIHEQVIVQTIDHSDPCKSMSLILDKHIAPYFKSYIKESRRKDGDGVNAAIEKSLNEVEFGIRRLQQNIDIPEIHLTIHPTIQNIVAKAKSENRKANITDLQEYVQDTTFLNALQNGVKLWITEIQKITKLDRDPSSGTALQEVAFWMNLERAISRVNEMRESEEVVLTLEALKLGKRFHATVSFDADTGLKETADKVTDYSQIMIDIPLIDLVSATDVIGVRQALANIFAALRKIRNSKYPAKRAMHFFAAISSDTCSEIIRVCVLYCESTNIP